MFCSFCGQEIRDGAVFCSSCGKNQDTGQMKPGMSPNKLGESKWKSSKKGIFFVIIVVLLAVAICVNAFGNKSIVGVWMDGTDKITFSSNGNFHWDGDYGTYTIGKDKTLVMTTGEYSYHSGEWRFEYNPAAKEDSEYWYISGGKLYFGGSVYTKK